ncbi:MAG: phospholipase [Tannerellaceae bacterium]|nr:phospholipase [Tannerellaceae bacterium]
MTILVISLITLGVLAAFLSFFRARQKGQATGNECTRHAGESPEGCCGRHATCERAHLLSASASSADGQGIDYYEDEELDRFQSFAPDKYTEDDVEEFRQILITMRADEVAGWLRSLRLRNIPLPTAVRDEALQIISLHNEHKPKQ